MSVVGKVLAQVIRIRLQPLRETIAREQQCGFRPGRGCIDQIFSVRQVLEERIRSGKRIIAIFIDFKSAFDSIHRDSLWQAMLATGVPCKLVKIIQAYYDGTESRVRANGGISATFPIRTGVRQGCVLSPMLFNVIIDWVMQKGLVDYAGVTCGADGLQVTDTAYADDIAIFEETDMQAQALLDSINDRAQKLGLRINAKKTKYFVTDGSKAHLTVNGEAVEQVDEFKYLGSLISASKIAASSDVTARIGNAQAAFASLKWCLWKRKTVSLKTKIRVFNAAIIPILLYASETWTLLANDLKKLEVFQMRCLRSILGISLLDRWRNELVRKTCCDQPTIEYRIRQSRFRWFGHVCRMDPSRLPKQLLDRKRVPGWKYMPNAAKKTWISQIMIEARRLRMSINDLKAAASDRVHWKKLSKNAIAMAATAPVGMPYNLRPRKSARASAID